MPAPAMLYCLLLLAGEPSQPLPATLHSIHDGDTLTATIHLPFSVDLPSRTIRAYGYDAWEIRKGRRNVVVTPEEAAKGLAAKAALADLLGKGLWVEDAGKRDPYGRTSAKLWTKTADGGWLDVSAWAKTNGHTRQ